MWKCINVESSLLWADGSEEEVHKNCTVANSALGWEHLKKGGGGRGVEASNWSTPKFNHLVLNKMNITSSSWQERGILIVQDTIWKVDRGKKLWLISWVQSKAWRHSWFFFFWFFLFFYIQIELDWLVTCLFFLLVCFFPLGWNGREKNSRHWSVL